MDNRRFLLALALSVAVLVAWQYLVGPPPPPPGATDAPAGIDETAGAPAAGEPLAKSLPREAPAAAESPRAAAAADPPALEAAAVEPVADEIESRWVVQTDELRAELTNRGAQLVSFQLAEHEAATGGPVDLVRRRVAGPYPFGLLSAGGEPSPFNDVLFVGERGRVDGADEVVFRYAGPEGTARKSFRFVEGGLIEVQIEADGGGAVYFGPGLRNPPAEELENRFARRTGVYRTAEDLEKIDPQKAKAPVAVPGAGLLWLGLQDTYFLTALVLSEPVTGAAFQPVLMQPGVDGAAPRFQPMPAGGELSDDDEDLVRELAVLVDLPATGLSGVAYFGPKRYSRLSALPYGLEETVDFGVFGFLARPLLVGLRWIYENLVGNWGWAIILMTVLIRILLFPLTHKSVVSMQKMQELNPKIQAIRQKYRGKLKDKQGRPNPELQRKMNEEIMALYKQEGVNPAGGCLPMLLQIPVLFAFYSLLSTTIELRHAPWILWIEDLAAPDPFYVLPIVMGASQFLQQRLTPTSADPMQRRIFMLMPIFFTVLFLGFPSGLVLYWLTNNVLGIVQQVVYKKMRDEPAPEAEGKKKKKKAKPQPSKEKA